MRERKPIDRELRRFLDDQAAALGGAAQTTEEARTRLMRALESRTFIPGLPNEVQSREVTIGPGLAARLYTPQRDGVQPPVLVYLHGGGWVIGSVATHDPFCRLLSQAAEVIVASIEYRLAPEHPYPAALEDTFAAIHCAAEHAAEWGGDLTRGWHSAGTAQARTCPQSQPTGSAHRKAHMRYAL